jgi:hypothetical protein
MHIEFVEIKASFNIPHPRLHSTQEWQKKNFKQLAQDSLTINAKHKFAQMEKHHHDPVELWEQCQD